MGIFEILPHKLLSLYLHVTFSCLVVQPPVITTLIFLFLYFQHLFFPPVAEVVWCLNLWNYAPQELHL